MKVGYARVSTQQQDAGYEDQQRQLMAAGCRRVVSEKASAVGKREAFDQLMESLAEGDVLYVTKLDRLARNVQHLLAIADELARRKIDLVILNMAGDKVDTRTPTGRLLLTMLGAVAEFERGMILERQRAGIAKAQSEGKYQGRKPDSSPHAGAVRALAGRGVGPTAIAAELGINRATVHRLLKAEEGLQGA
jgi:DNA invertase Pin-like site-specific DNA recombinase